MRYEAMRLLQFVFSLSLILAAFLGGVLVGWRRWGRPRPASSEEADPDPVDEFVDLRVAPGRPDLFAPASESVQHNGRVGAIPARARGSRAALPTGGSKDG